MGDVVGLRQGGYCAETLREAQEAVDTGAADIFMVAWHEKGRTRFMWFGPCHSALGIADRVKHDIQKYWDANT